MTYIFRERKPNVVYVESNDPESDSQRQDPDYSRSRTARSGKQIKRKNTIRSTPRADLIPSHGQSKRSRTSKKTAEGEQNKETNEVGQSSNMERNSFSRESTSPNMEKGSPSPEGQSSSVKRGSSLPKNKETSEVGKISNMERGSLSGEDLSPSMQKGSSSPEGQSSSVKRGSTLPQNKETTEVGQISNMERGSLSGEDLSPSKQKGSPSPEGQSSSVKRGSSLPQNKETNEVGQISNMERGSLSGEDLSPSMQKGSPSPEGQTSSMKRVSSLPEGTSSSKKTILSWLIDCKHIEEDEQVHYRDDTKETAAFKGRITRGGILCSCCQKEISVWTFEIHAGSDLKQPYEHIYLVKKATYLQDLLITAWNEAMERKRREIFSFIPKETSANQNDDTCSICGDGGDLICCEKCPSTFHAHCMNMERAPQRDWLCPYCVCKYCGLGGESELLITCSHCDKKFHWKCFNEFSKESMDISSPRLYCGQNCKAIYEKLQSSVAARTDVIESYCWKVIRPMDMTSKSLSARSQHLENNSKVAVACKLMNESFETITDRHTGINVVESVVYSRGSNLARINFSRFYTFILEKDDAIICAASIRIHGGRVAEMPFIATEKTCWGKGICGMLMMEIESFLCNLKVQNLIIPSVPDTSEMWKHKYGFKELTRELKREIASYNILMFPNALRLYKDLSSRTAGPGESLSLLDLNLDPPEGQ